MIPKRPKIGIIGLRKEYIGEDKVADARFIVADKRTGGVTRFQNAPSMNHSLNECFRGVRTDIVRMVAWDNVLPAKDPHACC